MKIERHNRITLEECKVDESIFSVANGYIGIRGTFCEGYGVDEYNQTLINGFYDYHDYHYEENLTGFPQKAQTIVNVLDGQFIKVKVDDEFINLTTCKVLSLERSYDLSKGITNRKIKYLYKDKYIFLITEKRFVSSEIQNLVYIDFSISSSNYDGEIEIISYLTQPSKGSYDVNDPRVSKEVNKVNIKSIDKKNSLVHCETNHSNLELLVKVEHNVHLLKKVTKDGLVFHKNFTLDKEVRITKTLLYFSSIYHDDVYAEYNNMSRFHIDNVMQKEEKLLEEFWNNSFIEIENKDFEKKLNYAIYQLNRSGGESSVHNIAAKGLSGEGYEGHYFWDTEIYFIPFFILNNPKKAKNLLMYRYNQLEDAYNEALNLGYTKGAKFPWRTINGQEASPFFEAGSAQFHINTDIAYAIIKYYEVTNDIEFIKDYGFEMLEAISEFFTEAVNYYDGKYHLNKVTGPDEYSTLVDDNYYTNSLIKYTFTRMLEIKKELSITFKKVDEELIQDIASNIALYFDEEKNIYLQDRNFLHLKSVDINALKRPMLLHYHPLFIYKHQVLKQADALLSLVLLDDQNDEVVKSCYDFYEPLTTHDSSLSLCIHSILAFKLNKKEALSMYSRVLDTDLENIQGNTDHGLHLASMGGSYLGFVYGVLGLRIENGYISIKPKYIESIGNYSIKIRIKETIAKISISDTIIIESLKTVSLKVYDEVVFVNGRREFALQHKK